MANDEGGIEGEANSSWLRQDICKYAREVLLALTKMICGENS